MTLSPRRLAEAGWSCVHFAADVPPADELARVGTAVVEVDGSVVDGKDALMGALAEALSFPGYFGRNWDALEECLRGLDPPASRGYAVVIRAAERLWREHPEISGKLVETWLSSAEHWARRDLPFHLVFEW